METERFDHSVAESTACRRRWLTVKTRRGFGQVDPIGRTIESPRLRQTKSEETGTKTASRALESTKQVGLRKELRADGRVSVAW